MEDLIKISVFDRYGEKFEFEVPDDIGISLMELCKANDLPIMATCGGMALCATCHVLVESDNQLKEMGEDGNSCLTNYPI